MCENTDYRTFLLYDLLGHYFTICEVNPHLCLHLRFWSGVTPNLFDRCLRKNFLSYCKMKIYYIIKCINWFKITQSTNLLVCYKLLTLQYLVSLAAVFVYKWWRLGTKFACRHIGRHKSMSDWCCNLRHSYHKYR